MRLQSRIILFIGGSLLLMTLALILIGWLTIQEVIRGQYEREMLQELNRVLLSANQVHSTMKKWGITNQDFIKRKQDEFLRQYFGYVFGETGSLTIIKGNAGANDLQPKNLIVPEEVIKEMYERNNGYLWIESEGVKYFTTFSVFDSWDWLFVLSITKSEMYAYRNNFLILVILVSLAVMLVTLTLASFMIKQVVKRINGMLACVQKIEEGNYSATIRDIDNSPELSRLQHGINSMVTTLRERTIEREDAEKALRDSEEKYRRLIETSNDAIYLMVNDKLEIVNKKFTDTFGYSREEITGTDFDFFTLVAPSSRQALIDRRKKIMERQSVSGTYFITGITRDGEEIEFEASVTYLESSDGFLVQGILRDLTQRKMLEQQLRHKQKMEAIGTLAGGIAHDFNNILSVILGYAELLNMEMDYQPENRSNLQEIIHAATRAKDLVGQITTFTRRTDWELVPVNVYKVIEDSMKLIKSLIPDKVKVETVLESQYFVMADNSHIHQIVLNLCMNAAFAMEKGGGVLTIALASIPFNNIPPIIREKLVYNHYVLLRVQDTGHGIPESIITRIFDPYFSTKPKDQGSGLGLAIVQGIVSTLNGAIDVQSEVGKGTIFDVYLPVAKQVSLPNAAGKSESRTKTTPQHILYVDDEVFVVDMIRKALTTYGYRITTRTSGQDAIELFRASPDEYDLVISDLAMPEVTGLDVARSIHGIKPDTPIMICTGFHERQDEIDIGKNGIRDVIIKPLSLQQLVLKIEEVTKPKEGNNFPRKHFS